MKAVSYLAQLQDTTSTYSTSSSIEGTAEGLAILASFMLFFVLLTVGIYIVNSLCLMKIFKKAGAPGWAAWVPVFNTWKTLEIGGQQGFWAILSLIPVVNIVSAVMLYIAQYHIGLKLGKGGAFILLALFFPIVWLIWLAVDKSVWNDSASPAPSLHQDDATIVAQSTPEPVAPVQTTQDETNTPTPPSSSL